MTEATAQDNSTRSPGQHADPFLMDAESAAKKQFHGDRRHNTPACQLSSAGLRILTVVDLSIGSRVNVGLGSPATLIGASGSHAIVRTDDGQVHAAELCELSLSNAEGSDGYLERLPIGAEDVLSHQSHLLAELQLAHPDDGLDAETMHAADDLRQRIAATLEATCARVFAGGDGDTVGGAA